MPSSPGKLCADCSSRAINGTKYCAAHQTKNRKTENSRLADRHRDQHDPLRALYRTPRWQATRTAVFRRDILCQESGGCPNKATVCDHYPLDARDIVAQRGVDAFYDKSNLRGLCRRHHDARYIGDVPKDIE